MRDNNSTNSFFRCGHDIIYKSAGKKESRNDPFRNIFPQANLASCFRIDQRVYFLWFWDILFMYAACGMLLFVFTRIPAKGLFIASGICLLLTTARENRDFYKTKSDIRKGEQVALLDTTTTKLNDEQKEALATMQDLKEKSSAESKKKGLSKTIAKRMRWLL